jgi:hypothetical protein
VGIAWGNNEKSRVKTTGNCEVFPDRKGRVEEERTFTGTPVKVLSIA